MIAQVSEPSSAMFAVTFTALAILFGFSLGWIFCWMRHERRWTRELKSLNKMRSDYLTAIEIMAHKKGRPDA